MVSKEDYVDIATAKPYPGELPKTVSVPVAKRLTKEMVVSIMESVSQDEPDYQKGLDKWMFQRGYVRIVKD